MSFNKIIIVLTLVCMILKPFIPQIQISYITIALCGIGIIVLRFLFGVIWAVFSIFLMIGMVSNKYGRNKKLMRQVLNELLDIYKEYLINSVVNSDDINDEYIKDEESFSEKMKRFINERL